MSLKADLLRVAPPKGTQHATNRVSDATTPATPNATSMLKTIASRVSTRNTHRNTSQQPGATERNKTPYESTRLLRPVAMVSDDQPDPIRWARFVVMCEAMGVTNNEVCALFSEEDIDDLCEEPDHKLLWHAATIVKSIKRVCRSQYSKPRSTARSKASPCSVARVRCGSCRHFEFNPQHPSIGLGSCVARSDVRMGIPARLIECTHYQQRERPYLDTMIGEVSPSN